MLTVDEPRVTHDERVRDRVATAFGVEAGAVLFPRAKAHETDLVERHGERPRHLAADDRRLIEAPRPQALVMQRHRNNSRDAGKTFALFPQQLDEMLRQVRLPLQNQNRLPQRALIEPNKTFGNVICENLLLPTRFARNSEPVLLDTAAADAARPRIKNCQQGVSEEHT